MVVRAGCASGTLLGPPAGPGGNRLLYLEMRPPRYREGFPGSDSHRRTWAVSIRRSSSLGWGSARRLPLSQRNPGLRNEELLVEIDGVAIGHAGQKVLGRSVQPLRLQCPSIQEFRWTLAHFVPQSAQDAGGFPELCGRYLVLVHSLEEERSQP